MAEIIDVPLGPHGDPARSPNVSAQSIVNGFVEPCTGGKAGWAIYSDPGYGLFASVATDGCRGGFTLGNNAYYVIGERLYKVTAGGASSTVGTIIGVRPIVAAQNQKPLTPQVVIVADTSVYVLEDGTLTEGIADLPSGVHSVIHMAGRFIYGLNDGRFYYSELNDTAINPLSFATAESNPDAGVRLWPYGDHFFYLGTGSIEAWYSQGEFEQPFERMQGGTFPRGCIAKMSVALCDNAVTFVADNGQVMQFTGTTPKQISVQAVEADIQDAIEGGNKEAMEAFVWSLGGHEFYQLSAPDWTWVWDASTRLWHRKQSYGLTGWRGRGYVRAFDKHLIGDVENGNIYEMSFDHEDENGEHLVFSLRSQPVSKFPFNIRHDVFRVDMQGGVGKNSTDTHKSDPKVMMRFSDDGGHLWSSNREAPLGKIGDYGRRVRFNRLGRSRSHGRTYEVSCSAPVRRALIRAVVEGELLRG